MQIPPISSVHTHFSGDSDPQIGKQMSQFQEEIKHLIGEYEKRSPPHLSKKEAKQFISLIHEFNSFLHEHALQLESMCKQAGGDFLDLNNGMNTIKNLNEDINENPQNMLDQLTSGKGSGILDMSNEASTMLYASICRHL